VLAPFRIRSFRFQWPSDLITSCAFEMEALILGWYVLVETGSVRLLSMFAALLYVGTLLSPSFGVIADRIGHRNLLCTMRAVYMVIAATLMTTAFAGALSPPVVFCIAGLMGLVRSSDLGVRWALVAHIVPPELLTGAMGISRTTLDAARVMGALTGASLFASLGIGAAYVVVTGLYAGALTLALTAGGPKGTQARVAPPGADASPVRSQPARSSHWSDLKEGLALVWSTPALLAATLMAVLVNLLAYPFCIQLLPYGAKEVYGVGEKGLGFLVASFGLGALLGSVASARHTAAPARTMMLSGLAWFACLLAFAQMTSFWSGAPMLALTGFVQSLCMVTVAVVLLDIAGGKYRGRIMGVRMLAIYGLPLGVLAGGALIDTIGFRATGTLYALAGIALTLVMAWRWSEHLRRADLPPAVSAGLSAGFRTERRP
jgi:predicted MFS family arabinose efflux permease